MIYIEKATCLGIRGTWVKIWALTQTILFPGRILGIRDLEENVLFAGFLGSHLTDLRYGVKSGCSILNEGAVKRFSNLEELRY